MQQGTKTAFGKAHDMGSIRTYADFKARVPIAEYEDFLPYVTRILQGEHDVLYPGLPAYCSITSGSVGGVKHIPLTLVSLRQYVRAGREAILAYVHRTKKAGFLGGKSLYLSGKDTLTNTGVIPSGRFSGIVRHRIPSYLRKYSLPSAEINNIDDFDLKIGRIVEETQDQDVRLISGITPWVLHYFQQLLAHTKQGSVGEVFGNLSLFIHGGVAHAPYQARLEAILGKALLDKVDTLELYPASEGFIAYQDTDKREAGLLLLCDHGVFYEFVPMDTYHSGEPTRLSLAEVELGVTYALLLTNQSGFWGYAIGDMVRFTSLRPYRIVFMGRVAHELTAFGEHVIAQEVEQAMAAALRAMPEATMHECTVAPYFGEDKSHSSHEWWIEFSTLPTDLAAFSHTLDISLQGLNRYYADLREGNILRACSVVLVREGGFLAAMQEKEQKNGNIFDPQKKAPRLSSNRDFVAYLANKKYDL